jgi:peptidyl-prolyl cis-trans isomerase C
MFRGFVPAKETAMTKRICLLLGGMAIVALLLGGCAKPKDKELGKDELVRVNKVSITLEEYRRMIDRLSIEAKMKVLEKGGKDYLENYVVTREVLYQEARKKGLDKDKEMIAKVEDFKRAMLIDALLAGALRGKDEVTDAEVQEYYKANPAKFTEPNEVRIRHLFVKDESVLKEALTLLAKGEPLSNLAGRFNEDKTRDDGGSLGWIKRGMLAPPFAAFEEAAFSLKKKGDRSDVVKTVAGYHVIQLDEARGTALRPFDQVKEQIRFYLKGKKKQEAYLLYVKETKARTRVTINEMLWAEEEKRESKAAEGKDVEPIRKPREKGSGGRPKAAAPEETGSKKPEPKDGNK